MVTESRFSRERRHGVTNYRGVLAGSVLALSFWAALGLAILALR